jgi:hypothetical protein
MALAHKIRHLREAGMSEPDEQQPFAMMPMAVVRQHDLSMGARVLYASLAFYARAEATCFPDEQTLAGDLGTSTRQVRAYLKELADAGSISIQRRAHGRGNVYTLHPDDTGHRKNTSAKYRKNTSAQPIPYRKNTSAGDRKNTSALLHEVEQETIFTPDGVNADAPPPTPQATPTQETREQPTESKSAPWTVAEACLEAQGRPATDKAVKRYLRDAQAEVVDAYAGRGVTVADVKACLAYLLSDPWVQRDPSVLTPAYLGAKLGPWVKAGKPAQYVEPARAKPAASERKPLGLSSIPERPKTREQREAEALIASPEYQARIAAEREARKARGPHARPWATGGTS